VSTEAAAPAAKPAEAREIQGPSAFGGGWRRFMHLTWLIAITDYRLTYFGSVLGYVWSLMRPLLLFGVLYLVFSQFLRFGDDIPHYRDLLLLNIMLYYFFGEATSNSVRSVLARESLVRKMHFPRMVIPLSVVVTSMLNLAANLVAVFVFITIDGVEPRATWLLAPLLLIPLVMFTAGVAMILSSLYVSYRDVQPIWSVLSQLIFYGSPILYVIDTVPESMQEIIMANPLACILEQARKWLVDPTAPGFVEAIGGFPLWLVPVGIFVAVCGLGLWIFNREAPRIAERL
jgi:ABC-2 type transport system permease protein